MVNYRLYALPWPSAERTQREVLMLVGDADDVLWSDASDSPVRLPDSRARWEAIWSRRDRIVEIAHSHPVGPLAFSREDRTTMRALVTALGRPLIFSIVAPGGVLRRVEPLEPVEGAALDDLSTRAPEEPWWTALLRLASGMATSARDPRSARRSRR